MDTDLFAILMSGFQTLSAGKTKPGMLLCSDRFHFRYASYQTCHEQPPLINVHFIERTLTGHFHSDKLYFLSHIDKKYFSLKGLGTCLLLFKKPGCYHMIFKLSRFLFTFVSRCTRTYRFYLCSKRENFILSILETNPQKCIQILQMCILWLDVDSFDHIH